MIIIDGHLDLSWNALQGNRNLLQSVEKTRKAEGKSKNTTTVALPEMKKPIWQLLLRLYLPDPQEYHRLM